MLRPASRQIDTRRVASSMPEVPKPSKAPLPPKPAVPKLSTGTFSPERPN